MPAIQVVFFKDDDGSVPLLEWLDRLKPEKAVAKCLVLVELLAQLGPGMRRPYADYLRDGIYELRTHWGRVHYRMLYGFHEQAGVISHGFSKTEAKVDPREIELAITRLAKFKRNPKKHTHEEK